MVSSTTSSSMSSALVADWTQAVQQANVERVEALLNAHPDLYSTALEPWDPELDAAHVISQLHIVQGLGTSLQGLNALQYTLLQHLDSPADALTDAQLQTAELVDILLEVSAVLRFFDLNLLSTYSLLFYFFLLVCLKPRSIPPNNTSTH